ncbi:MAG: AsmA family protein, partial [Stellaceae bacterium]
MRKAAILLGILVVLVLAGLILAPQLVDLDRFKAPIAAQLGKRAGHPVELAGPIALSLLPSPAVTAQDVRIANPPGATAPHMVRLRALEVKLAVLPLLAGRIELSSATLIEPEIDLEHLPDGTPNWRSPPPAAAPNRASPPPEPETAPAAAGIATLMRLAIQNGAVTWRAGDGVERFEHINADMALDPASGQIGASGNLVARGAAVSFELRSGAPDAPEMPVQLTVTTKPAARLQLDALLTGRVDDRRISGKLKLTGDDARALLGTLAHIAVPAPLAQPIAASADLAASLRQLTLDHLALDLGPAHGEGRLQLDAGTPLALALTLSVGQLDLDRWPGPRKAALAPASFGSAFAAVPAASAVLPVPRAGSSLSLPAGINAKLDIDVDAALWHGGLVRDAQLKLMLAGGRLTLSRLAGQLPGGSTLSLSGSGALTPDGPRAEAALKVTADDLRSLCGWFGATLETIPPDRLRKATLSSHLALTGDRLDIDHIDGTLDATRLSGAATVLLRARPGIGLRVAADRFSLDAYLPRPVAPPPAAAAAPATTAVAAAGG